jgi:hypothetical protein
MSTTNTTKILKLVTCLAWAGAAISSATPVNASVITSQTGSYATCSPMTEIHSAFISCAISSTIPDSFESWYAQTIRFVGVGCSSGGCSEDASWVYTDIEYGTGRKTTQLERSCRDSNMKIYGLGTCAC